MPVANRSFVVAIPRKVDKVGVECFWKGLLPVLVYVVFCTCLRGAKQALRQIFAYIVAV